MKKLGIINNRIKTGFMHIMQFYWTTHDKEGCSYNGIGLSLSVNNF